MQAPMAEYTLHQNTTSAAIHHRNLHYRILRRCIVIDIVAGVEYVWCPEVLREFQNHVQGSLLILGLSCYLTLIPSFDSP